MTDDSVPTRLVAPVLPVSLLVSSARLLLERHLGLVWVAGEVFGYTRAASGHMYFTLKDATAQVRCVFFRTKSQGLSFVMRDGLAIEVRATPSIYEARGEFQLNVDNVRVAGQGALYERFLRLKKKLEAAGWFADARKRPLPTYPRVVGVITSTRAAALSDVLTTLARRWPALSIVVYPTAVQGEGAAQEIAAAIVTANAHAKADVLILCRGGGSLEDLWAFNEEAVARAVFESALPVVSGVGHETDFTICDFVADVRAPTPTAAAALVVADRATVLHKLEQVARRLARNADHDLATRMQRLDLAARRLIHPAARLAQQQERAATLAKRLARAWRLRLNASQIDISALSNRMMRELRAPLPRHTQMVRASEAWQRVGRATLDRRMVRVAALAQNLAHLNPHAVLERGYAIVTAESGKIVHDAAQVAPRDNVTLTFARGRAGATITRTET
jgi:exodeoxyribonuclease VII large subunit